MDQSLGLIFQPPKRLQELESEVGDVTAHVFGLLWYVTLPLQIFIFLTVKCVDLYNL